MLTEYETTQRRKMVLEKVSRCFPNLEEDSDDKRALVGYGMQGMKTYSDYRAFYAGMMHERGL